ncbi:MAG: peptide deformylase [Pseudomonadota bacterium]
MALLNILHYPDNKLRTKAKTVQQVTNRHLQLLDDMLETMYDAPGIGLAATQIDVHEELIVIDISEDKSEPLCLINPVIIEKNGVEISEEGCLSVPETYAEVERAESIRFTAIDREGNSFEMQADGLLAICVQHEIDHLQGKLFVDYLSKLKRERIRKKIEKLSRKKI